MNFPLYIAKRYLRSASKNNAINIINGIAALGVVVGSMALFVVLSVFSGLKEFSLSFTNEFDPDLKITSTYGKSFLLTPKQELGLTKIQGLSSSSKVIEERVLFLFDGKEQVTYIKGVDSVFEKVNPIQKIIYQGQWLEKHTNQVVVGYGICQKLSMGLFDFNHPFEVFVPKAGRGAIENPDEAFNRCKLAPVGIYAINEDLDSKFVFADLTLTQALLEFKPNQISGIECKLKPGADEQKVIQELEQLFPKNNAIKTRAQLNDSLYKMLNTENIAVYLIFTLVIIVALFNLVGALIMMILDKKHNLKTLYNLGAEIKHLRSIFLLQGALLSIVGGCIGLVLGIVVVLLQQQFQWVMITPNLAYPVVFSVQNILIVLTTIFSLGLIASWIASSRVTQKLLEKF
ncbi:MAG: FtsX-like permease family protein [Flavobacteriaceae bacterium]